MKIAFINGSPKMKNSSSGCVLQALKPLLPAEHEIIEFQFKMPKISDDDLRQITACSILVFAFPLYVDGIPAHLLNCLYQMEMAFKTASTNKMTVYSLVNSGFFEGKQNAIALELMKNWCQKSGLNWGQGIGIGGGGMLPMMVGVPDGKGPKKNLTEALTMIAGNIPTGAMADNIYISPNLPRFAYKLGAEMGWRAQAKANGLKPKDLFAKK